MYRVEDKYICSERDLLILQSRVKTILDVDRYSNDCTYKVTSLYFDDYFDDHLDDSEEGVSYRKKYRIRMYNNSQEVIKLEVKYKMYNRVFKKSRIISKEDARKLISGVCIIDDDVSIDNPVSLFNIAICNDYLRPKIVVEYDRSAFTYSCGNVRITFDRNIRWSQDIDGFMCNSCAYTNLDEMSGVLEVKYDEFMPHFIAQTMETGNLTQSSFSKYKLCREHREVLTCQLRM